MPPRLFATLALVAFAANSLLARVALRGDAAGPASYTAVRLASGALVLWWLVRRRAARSSADAAPPAPRPGWGGAVALAVYALAFSVAYVRIDAGIGALLLFGAVQLTMQGLLVLRGDRPALRHWSGLALALAGLAVLVRPGASAPQIVPAALMATAGAAWGAYTLLGRGVSDPLAATRDHFVRATPLALAVLLCWPAGGWLTPAGAAWAIASGTAASALGYVAWYAALRHLAPRTAGLLQLAVPPLAAFGGVLLLGERPTLRLAAASVLVLGGIALATGDRTRGPR